MSETGVGFQHAFQPSSCPPLFAVPARQTRGTIPVHTAAAGFARARAHTHTHTALSKTTRRPGGRTTSRPSVKTPRAACPGPVPNGLRLRRETVRFRGTGTRPFPDRNAFIPGTPPPKMLRLGREPARFRDPGMSSFRDPVHSSHSFPEDAPFGTGASPLQRHWNVFIQRPCSFQALLLRRCSVWDGSQPAPVFRGTPASPKTVWTGRPYYLQRHSSVPEDSGPVWDGTPTTSSGAFQSETSQRLRIPDPAQGGAGRLGSKR